jgi:putative MATE family efflux protein
MKKLRIKYMQQEKRGFYHNFFAIYIVLVLQNVVTLSVNLADNIMIGAYSETALAGVAAVNQIQFVYQQVLGAFGDGLVMFGSQYWGKGQIRPMKKIAATAMQAAVLTGGILLIIISFFPHQAVGLFTTDQPIIEEGVRYLNIVRFTYLFFAVSQLLLASLRMIGTVKIAFHLSVMTFFVNCGINFVLISGRFGMPALGVRGAAIGTLIARMLECIILILYIWKKEDRIKLTFRDYLKADVVLAKDYAKVALPIVVVQALWGMSTAMQTVILGHMTSAAIAANSVASTLFMIVKSMAYGASSAASILIGTAIGEGNERKVMEYSKRLQKIFLLIGAFGGILLFFIRIPVLSLYDLSPATKQMANTFLMILSVIFIGMSYQMPTNNGIIRGGGSAMYVVKLDLVSIWMIVLPLSFLMAFVFGAPPAVVVCCLNADQIFKCVPAYLMSHYGKWMKKLTRDDW